MAACEQAQRTQVAASKSPEPRVVGSRTVSQTQSYNYSENEGPNLCGFFALLAQIVQLGS